MPRTPLNVLLIEDDEEDYLITRDLLTSRCDADVHMVREATLEDGLQRIGRGGIDAVLLDLSLPESRGRSTFDLFHSRYPDMPVVLLTGIEDDMLALEILDGGAQDYLVKGKVTGDHLVRSLRYAIHRKRVETRIRQSEERLRQARGELEVRVAERTRELADANESLRHEVIERRRTEANLRLAISQLESHDRAKTEFVSNVSHELRTPLTSMGYAAENLLAGVLGPLPDRVRSYVAMIKKDCERLTSTVNDILDLSRLEANRLQLVKVKVPLARLVGRVMDLLSVEGESRGLQVARKVVPGVGFVECDPRKIERVVANVLQNALKYTPRGGHVVVEVSRDAGPPERACVSIADDGIGIPAENLPHITERYYRVGEHVTGTGLGLSLSKDLVELHGGSLEIESPPRGCAKGTRVCIRLPLGSGPMAWVIGCDEAISALLQRQLIAAGYEVRAFGRDASLPLADGPKPDVALVEMTPGDGNGLAWREKLGVPIIAIRFLSDAAGDDVLQGIPILHGPWKESDLLETAEQVVLKASYETAHT